MNVKVFQAAFYPGTALKLFIKEMIMNIDRWKLQYLIEGLTPESMPEHLSDTIGSLLKTEHLYLSAARAITTKLEILNEEFKNTNDRNPIQFIKSRIKNPLSIYKKLQRKSLEINEESARKNINDIAGIRVICSYINDIYLIADLLTSQDDIQLIRVRDYIKNPKPNGYRSLHLIVSVPVFLSDHKEIVKAEIQIRTIAMDFWASLEHELAYKLEDKSSDLLAELKDCSDVISKTDKRMQKLYNEINGNGKLNINSSAQKDYRKKASNRIGSINHIKNFESSY